MSKKKSGKRSSKSAAAGQIHGSSKSAAAGQLNGAVPEVSASNIRYEKWVTRAYGFAAACLFALALVEFFDIATPQIQTLLMLGIVAAGTAAWVLQAKRICHNCGQLYGYHFRLVKANMCHECGAEYPKWRPGLEDGENDNGSG